MAKHPQLDVFPLSNLWPKIIFSLPHEHTQFHVAPLLLLPCLLTTVNRPKIIPERSFAFVFPVLIAFSFCRQPQLFASPERRVFVFVTTSFPHLQTHTHAVHAPMVSDLRITVTRSK